MKLSGKILLIVFLILLPIFSVGCNQPPPTNTGNNANPPLSDEQNTGGQQDTETTPAFALAELYSGKDLQIPADIKGSKTALVFFSLT